MPGWWRTKWLQTNFQLVSIFLFLLAHSTTSSLALRSSPWTSVDSPVKMSMQMKLLILFTLAGLSVLWADVNFRWQRQLYFKASNSIHCIKRFSNCLDISPQFQPETDGRSAWTLAGRSLVDRHLHTHLRKQIRQRHSSVRSLRCTGAPNQMQVHKVIKFSLSAIPSVQTLSRKHAEQVAGEKGAHFEKCVRDLLDNGGRYASR